MADILDVSIDSAYRRIRGKPLSRSRKFTWLRANTTSVWTRCSGSRSDTVTFAYTKLTDSVKNFQDYFDRIVGHLRTISKFGDGHIYYVAEEMPLFYSFSVKTLRPLNCFAGNGGALMCPITSTQNSAGI